MASKAAESCSVRISREMRENHYNLNFLLIFKRYKNMFYIPKTVPQRLLKPVKMFIDH